MDAIFAEARGDSGTPAEAMRDHILAALTELADELRAKREEAK